MTISNEGMLHLEHYAKTHDAAYPATSSLILDALAELKERRAADLRDAEREALEVVAEHCDDCRSAIAEDVIAAQTVRALLDRLTKAGR
jgi:hypothetical protein